MPDQDAANTQAERRTRRVWGAVVALGCLALLGVASSLQPSPSGSGTHLQLGLMQCGFVAAFGRPCPTCGMTTAFAWAAHGHPLESARTQPMGAVLVVATTITFWLGLYAAVTGARTFRLFAFLLETRWVVVMLALGAAAWVYKIYHFQYP